MMTISIIMGSWEMSPSTRPRSQNRKWMWQKWRQMERWNQTCFLESCSILVFWPFLQKNISPSGNWMPVDLGKTLDVGRIAKIIGDMLQTWIFFLASTFCFTCFQTAKLSLHSSLSLHLYIGVWRSPHTLTTLITFEINNTCPCPPLAGLYSRENILLLYPQWTMSQNTPLQLY